MSIQDILNKLYDKLDGWLEAFVLKLPNLVAALVVVIATWIVGRLLQKAIERLMQRMSGSVQISHLVSHIAYFAVMVAGAFIALGMLGAEKTVTSLLAGAGIIGLAMGLAFQAMGENFVAGIYLAVRRPFQVGQIVQADEYYGVVEKQDLRSTWVRTPQGQLVMIPNKQIFSNPLVNFSEGGLRRIDLGVGVTYDADLEKVQQVSTDAVKTVEGVLDERPVECFFKEFGDSSINCDVRFWIRFGTQADFMGIRSAAVIAIKKAFDANDITIPFPIRTLDFGPVGGETLAQVLERKSSGLGN